MDNDEFVWLLVMSVLLVGLVYALLSIIAGNIVNQLLAPVPSIAGPLGAAVALFVFIYLLFKTANLVFAS